MSVSDTEVRVSSGTKGVVNIARAGIAKIQVKRSRGGSQVAELRREFRGAMRHSLRALFSPRALAGAVEVPIVLAWGATALPFCILGDIPYEPGSVEVRPI